MEMESDVEPGRLSGQKVCDLLKNKNDSRLFKIDVAKLSVKVSY